jgi:phosphatidylserine/phosphatidylglycerophosphate/cardiolipin synthase-like enzyme
MGWNDDAHGIRLPGKAVKEIKVYHPGTHSWASKLKAFHRFKKDLAIVTYSLPSLKILRDLLGSEDGPGFLGSVRIIAHSKFSDTASTLVEGNPKLQIRLLPNVHAKMVLVGPDTVYIGSANFGHSGWLESNVGIRSEEVFARCLEEFEALWLKASTEFKNVADTDGPF